ncbi:hypothetical protein [Enterococcus rivorum]|uniref:Uncharacterized protein n=1 Tax=Enterococcus rivorum TaxID=762845 RepID=A0A1E5L0W6_9ENTE|nr:hypothetical protein [Enterococcus rivorum]MBP2098827.1 gamma-glutamylcyclotransferase (GGCT)/AIG2-like uncharacterized protein YtfP [Enterococcus rivorum]OEH83559.1 hypothetical protein BCR26_08755 [Enterococcus rivorum]
MIPIEEKKVEAVKRLNYFDLHSDVIRQFEDDSIVFYTERSLLNVNQNKRVIGVLYHVTEEMKTLIESFQQEYSALVYHVVKTNTEFGLLYDFMYVSNHSEEWPDDHEDLKNNTAFVYCNNISDPHCSEYGTIAIQASGGGLIRIS